MWNTDPADHEAVLHDQPRLRIVRDKQGRIVAESSLPVVEGCFAFGIGLVCLPFTWLLPLLAIMSLHQAGAASAGFWGILGVVLLLEPLLIYSETAVLKSLITRRLILDCEKSSGEFRHVSFSGAAFSFEQVQSIDLWLTPGRTRGGLVAVTLRDTKREFVIHFLYGTSPWEFLSSEDVLAQLQPIAEILAQALDRPIVVHKGIRVLWWPP